MEDFEQSQKPQMQAVAVISLVLGILCMIFGCMLIGIAFGIASLILATIYMVKSNGKYLVLVIIGMILSTIGLILSIAMIILVASETDLLEDNEAGYEELYEEEDDPNADLFAAMSEAGGNIQEAWQETLDEEYAEELKEVSRQEDLSDVSAHRLPEYIEEEKTSEKGTLKRVESKRGYALHYLGY